ncbi:SDR family oxidoreductase [Photobacterium sagamiensis]|uniref:SDR family oxidoreductase n=1 Tax=Photobacterium sagamiensis TaxID=2910241 RepID=UPI003D10E99D
MTSKVFLVTGGANGIGKSICKMLVKINAIVIAIDINEEAGFELVAEEPRIRFRCADVTIESELSAVINEIGSQFGQLDGLVNNAAIANPYNPPLDRLDIYDWNRVLQVNLTAPLMLTKLCLPLLRESKGSVVNISSTRAQQSEPNTEAYSASKGGLVALTHALANSLGPDIRVNCISPGWINTTDETLRPVDEQQHLTGRVGHVDDVASMVTFLLSEQSGFITGQNFTLDGGMTKKMIYAQ